jgi:hypothetical protein
MRIHQTFVYGRSIFRIIHSSADIVLHQLVDCQPVHLSQTALTRKFFVLDVVRERNQEKSKGRLTRTRRYRQRFGFFRDSNIRIKAAGGVVKFTPKLCSAARSIANVGAFAIVDLSVRIAIWFSRFATQTRARTRSVASAVLRRRREQLRNLVLCDEVDRMTVRRERRGLRFRYIRMSQGLECKERPPGGWNKGFKIPFVHRIPHEDAISGGSYHALRVRLLMKGSLANNLIKIHVTKP